MNYIKTTLTSLRWAVVAYVMLRVFTCLVFPEYYTRKATVCIARVWVPHHLVDPSSDMQKAQSHLTKARISFADFQKLSATAPSSMWVSDDQWTLNYGLIKDDLVLVSEVPILDQKLPAFTQVDHVRLSKSGYVYFDLRRDTASLYISAVMAALILLISGFVAWLAVLIVQMVAYFIFGMCWIVTTSLMGKTSEPPKKLDQLFLPV